MEAAIGIRGKGFVLMAADQSCARSIVVMKSNADKIYSLSDRLLMAAVGESGDAVQFAEYIEKNIKLYHIRNGYELSVDAAAKFTRRQLAQAIRSRHPYSCNSLLAGVDADGAALYQLDYLGGMICVPFGAHGYSSFFILSLLDKYWHEDLTKDEAMLLMQKLIDEVAHRFLVDLPSFKVKMVDENGIVTKTNMKANRK